MSKPAVCFTVLLLLVLIVRWGLHVEEIALYTLSVCSAQCSTVVKLADAIGLPRLTTIDPANLRRVGSASIDDVHTRGLLHRGIWLFVREPAGRILLMRRSASVVTCPHAWGLVGEHSLPDEPWKQTAQRAVQEELGLSLPLVRFAMLGQPVLFRTDYTRDGGLNRPLMKQDLQVTALLLAELPAPASALPPFKYDGDVAETTWLLPAEIERRHLGVKFGPASSARANHSGINLCNQPIRELLVLALHRLREVAPSSRVELASRV